MANGFSFKSLALAAAICGAFAAPVAAHAASLGTVQADTTQLLVIDWSLDAGFSGNLALSAPLVNWGATLTFNQAANTVTVQSNHIIAPHGEAAMPVGEYGYSGPIVNKMVFALPSGPLTLDVPVIDTKAFGHGGHSDVFTFYSTSSTHGVLIAQHVPEPETFALALAGLGVVGTVARRRQAA